jgi:hypothetical protein
MPIFAHHDATGKIVAFVKTGAAASATATARLIAKPGIYVTEIPELSASETRLSIDELREIGRTRTVSPNVPQGRLAEKS